MPSLAGKLLGLNETKIENAVGIKGNCSAVLGILDTLGEKYTMTKKIQFQIMDRTLRTKLR